MAPVVNEQPKTEHSSKQQIIKIIFVSVVIILVFAVFNYFNIIPNKSSKQDNKLTTTTSTTKYSPDTFQYDTQKAEKMLMQYIKDTIKPEFLPAKIEVKQGLTLGGGIEDIKHQFGSNFTSPTASFFAGFEYMEGSNNFNYFAIIIQLNNITETDLTTTLTNSLTTQYFNNPYPVTSCAIKETISICELLKTEPNEKRGFGAFYINSNNNFRPIILTCSIPRENKDFDAKQSCIPL